MPFTNITGVSLPLAVWLASDDYDFHPGDQKAISVTSLLKPVRQILLRERLTEATAPVPDVSDKIPSRLGHSIHDSIERSWRHNHKQALKSLGYPEHIVERVEINPKEITEETIPVYLEQREFKEFMGYTITGKYDMVLDGELHDFKTTSVYSQIKGDKDEDYRLQGSLYRWLNPLKITKDHMYIQFIFTDWSKAKAKQSPGTYPPQRILPHRIELMSLRETERWVEKKIRALEAEAELPEPELTFCTDKELWRQPTVWKYFSDPNKLTRATKNFTVQSEAESYRLQQGRGIVIEFPGKVRACSYCPAFPICTQKDLYEHD